MDAMHTSKQGHCHRCTTNKLRYVDNGEQLYHRTNTTHTARLRRRIFNLSALTLTLTLTLCPKAEAKCTRMNEKGVVGR